MYRNTAECVTIAFFSNLILSSSRRQITGESTVGRGFFLIIQEHLKV